MTKFIFNKPLTTFILTACMGLSGCNGEDSKTNDNNVTPPVPEVLQLPNIITNTKVNTMKNIPIYQSVLPQNGQTLSISSIRYLPDVSTSSSCPQPTINGLEIQYTQPSVGVCSYEYTMTDGQTTSIARIISNASLSGDDKLPDISKSVNMDSNLTIPVSITADENMTVISVLGNGIANVDGKNITYTPYSIGLARIVYTVTNQTTDAVKIGIINVTVSQSGVSNTPPITPDSVEKALPGETITITPNITDNDVDSEGGAIDIPQLINVVSTDGAAVKSVVNDGPVDSNYFTNKAFTFKAALPGIYTVFYTAHDHRGGYNTGKVTVIVEGKVGLLARDASFYRKPSNNTWNWAVDLRSYIVASDMDKVTFDGAEFDSATSGELKIAPGTIIPPTTARPILTYQYPGGNKTGIVVIKYTVNDASGKTSGRIFLSIGEVLPKITTINIEPHVYINEHVEAKSTCEYCIPNKTKYEWWYGHELYSQMNSLTIPKGANGEKLTLIVTPYNKDNFKGPSNMSPYQYIFSVNTIYSNNNSFAALKGNGRVVTWGNAGRGGDSSSVQSQLINVKKIIPNAGAYAALKQDGTVVTWGVPSYGGDSSAIQSSLIDITSIYATNSAFAALKKDGTVITWGNVNDGGDNSLVVDKLVNISTIFPLDNIKQRGAFAALKKDGTVVTWGDPTYGGDSTLVQSQLSDISSIYSTSTSYAALKKDGTVVTWGNVNDGGDSSLVQSQLSDVNIIYSNEGAFAALKKDGAVVTWGDPNYGGDSSLVSSQLKNIKTITTLLPNYASLQNKSSFAALANNGSVITWGNAGWGGDSSSVQSQLINVKKIVPNAGVYAALKQDGTVVTWGVPSYGSNTSSLETQLVNVKDITATNAAFAALKQDGTVITWGYNLDGGDNSLVKSQLIDVKTIYPLINSEQNGAFAAIANGDNVVVWGSIENGGDNLSVKDDYVIIVPLHSEN